MKEKVVLLDGAIIFVTVLPFLLLLLATGGSAPPSAPSSRGEPVAVHGQWTIEVRNPDGSLAERREFDNALACPGCLANWLARKSSVGLWMVLVGNRQNAALEGPCLDAQNRPTACALHENASLVSPDASRFKTLSVNAPTQGVNQNRLVLNGFFTASADNSINSVATHTSNACPPDVPPAACVDRDGYSPFTATRLEPPIGIINGQAVAVTVVISFMTASGDIVPPTATVPVPAPTATADGKLRPIPVLQAPAANPMALKGGIFRAVGNTYPPDFSVWETGSGGIINGTAPRNDTLLEYNAWEPNKGEQLLPNLAYDWYTDPTGSKWTFLLRPNIKFHDGSPFGCVDAKFMLETIKSGRDATGDQLRVLPPRAMYLSRVKAISCPDANTMVIVTDGPNPSLPSIFALGAFGMMPKAVFEGHLADMQTKLGPGLGPFKADKIVPGEGYTMVRNENYWNQPYPYLDGFEFTNMGSSTATLAAFRVGRAESGHGRMTEEIRKQLIDSGRARRNTPYAQHTFDGLQANWQRQPWGDPRFSQAMRCAMDSAEIIATAMNGNGYESPIWPLAELPGGSQWGISKEEWKAISPCHGPTAETDMPKRIQIAQDLMAQLGFGPNNTARPKTHLLTPHTSLQADWPVVLAQFKKVWIEPEWVPLDYPKSYERNYAGDFDINIWNFITARFDPDTLLYEQYYSTSDRNFGKYTKPELYSLIGLQSRTLDQAKRQEIVKQIDKILLKNNVKVWMYQGMDTTMVPTWVMDYKFIEPSNQNTTSKLTRVWIDQAKMKEVLGF